MQTFPRHDRNHFPWKALWEHHAKPHPCQRSEKEKAGGCVGTSCGVWTRVLQHGGTEESRAVTAQSDPCPPRCVRAVQQFVQAAGPGQQ